MRRGLLTAAAVIMGIGAAACSTSISARPSAAPVVATATVLRAVDGDTVDVNDDRRGRLRVRLLGIDVPEVTVS
jgi:micrococcal nuclease